MGGGQALVRSAGAAFAAAVLAALYLALATGGPRAVGAWQDDAIYLATAKSLAEGRGYRHAELPGEPYQTKYPVLYPAVLAALWRAAPDHPENLPLLLAPTALAAATFVLLSAAYCRRFLGASAREAAGLALLTGLSPALLSMVRFTMSDLLYAALAVSALLALDGAEERARRGAPTARAVLASALLLGVGALTRSIGVSLAAGALLWLLARRRWRAAALLTGGVALCLTPWLAWQAWAGGANAASHGGPLLRSELSYAVWMPREIGESLRVVLYNAFRSAFGLLYFQLAIPLPFAARALAGPSWHAAALHVAASGASALLVVGFASSFRARPRALHAAAAVYAAVVLAYPGDPYRFLLPWTPFLLFFLLRGVRVGVAAAARRTGRAGWVAGGTRWAEGAMIALLTVLFAAETSRLAASSDARFHFRVEPGRSFAELYALESQLRALTRPRDVVVSGDAAALYLATGRQGYPPWPRFDPYALFYSPDRSFWSFTIRSTGETDLAARAVDRELEAGLADAWREAGVDWYVDHARPDVVTEAVRRFAEEHPSWFSPRARTPGGRFVLYRLRLPF